FQAEDGIRDFHVTGVQTCALPICTGRQAARTVSCKEWVRDMPTEQVHQVVAPMGMGGPGVPTVSAGREVGWLRFLPAAAIFSVLCLVPVLSHFLGHTYYLDLVARIMILGLAAVGLNLILGYGGMVSFVHVL